MSNSSGMKVSGSDAVYAPFGEMRGGTSLSTLTDFGYTGQQLDRSTGGLMYYSARYYLPELRRFISADTIVPGAGNPQAYNRYSYVLNNPLMYADPTGHSPLRCGGRLSCPVSRDGGSEGARHADYYSENPSSYQTTNEYCSRARGGARLHGCAAMDRADNHARLDQQLLFQDVSDQIQWAVAEATIAQGSNSDPYITGNIPMNSGAMNFAVGVATVATISLVEPTPAGEIVTLLTIGVGVMIHGPEVIELTVDLAENIIEAKKTTKQSGKAAATDIPSWARGEKPLPGEAGKDTAKRLLDAKYGPGNWPTGGGSEYSQLQKHFDRKGK